MTQLQDDYLVSEVVDLVQGEGCWSTDLECPIVDSEITAVERELCVRLPRSYRQFIRYLGVARVKAFEFYGLPRDGLWGDIVFMNHRTPGLPSGYVRFSRERGGREYGFDTERMSLEGECPVVLLNGSRSGVTVARSFLEFLHMAVCSDL